MAEHETVLGERRVDGRQPCARSDPDETRIGIGDDVFELGAHSLMTMRALTRIRDIFNVDLMLRHLFERPTVAGLAEIIDQLVWASREPEAKYSTEYRVEIAI